MIIGNAKKRRHFDMSSDGTGIPTGRLIDILNSAGRKHPGGFGDFSRGRGSFGGGRGGGSFGGFGGFGGGSFGGGGAGGSW